MLLMLFGCRHYMYVNRKCPPFFFLSSVSFLLKKILATCDCKLSGAIVYYNKLFFSLDEVVHSEKKKLSWNVIIDMLIRL